jgi:PhnB protein
MTVKAIPEGFHTLTPQANLVGCDKAIEFFKKAFGAEEKRVMREPGGKVMHAELKIGDSILMLGEAVRDPVSNLNGMLYVNDCDAVFKRAVDAGATALMPVADMPWGDRAGRVRDPFGNHWFIGTHKEDVPDAEVARRMAALHA